MDAWNAVTKRQADLKTAQQSVLGEARFYTPSYGPRGILKESEAEVTLATLSSREAILDMAGDLAFLTQLTLMNKGMKFSGVKK